MDADVVIVGSGQAGVPLATKLAESGRRVVLAERSHLGGTCVNYGCTPTKTLIASARAAHVARTAGRLGVAVDGVTVDFPAVVARKDRMVEEWREAVRKQIEGAGDRLTLLRGHARFTAPRTVRVGEATVSADVVIVNAGARPAEPAIPGLADVPWLDNADVMALPSLPGHLLVIGGGYVGCELGQAFRRFGSRVTIIDHAPRLLSREDPEISEAVEAAFREEGIGLRLGTGVARVARRGAAPEAEARPGADGAGGVEGAGGADGVAVHLEGGAVVAGTHLLVAVGRRPNTDDLDVEAGGLELDDGGAIRVDDRYRTSADGVYAVGDVAGGPQFTHASWDDHRILFALLNGDDRRTRADRVVPYAVFTDPQVARVGLSEREARERGVEFEMATMPFSHIARARETGREAGFMKLLVDREGRVLGAALAGAEAGELIHVFVALMSAGAPVRALVDMEVVHPTFAEGLQGLALRLDRNAT